MDAGTSAHLIRPTPTTSPAPAPSVFQPARRRRTLIGYVVAAVLIAGFGFGLRHNALFTGFAADDFAQLGMLRGDYLVPRSPLNLFNFSDGSRSETQRLLHGGFYPWWAHPEVRLSMLRPLASGLMWLDWTLFGTDPIPYHVHSACWWLLMLGLVAWVLYRLLPVPVALLAFAFFTCDEALGLPLGWVANRNALISTAFSCIALIAYLRGRERGTRRDPWLAAGAYCVALAGGEYALCALGYFLAYELLVAREAPARRLRALGPVLLPALAFVALRSLLGLGPRHSGVYLDPLAEPLDFALASLQRLPALIADLVLSVRSDWWTFGSPWVHTLLQARWVGEDWLWSVYPWRRVHLALGIAALLLLAAIVRAVPRDPSTRNARWLFAGGALSLPAVIGSFPSSRLVLVALLGFSALFATFAYTYLSRLREPGAHSRVRTPLGALAAGCFTLYQLGVGSAQTYAETLGVATGANAVRQTVLDMDVDERKLPSQRLVMLVTLEGGASLYIPLTRALHGKSVPRNCWTLSLTPADHLITRDSERSFVLSPMGGFTLLAGAPESMLRSTRDAFRVGDTIDVGGMRVKVLATLHGRPKSIRATFDVPLEHPSLLFVRPTSSGIRPFEIPELGRSVVIPFPGTR